MCVRGIDLGGLLSDQHTCFVRAVVPAEELCHQTQPHRKLIGLPAVHGEHPVLIIGEFGELTCVIPHPGVGGVEQVGAVSVDLDTGLRFGFGVGVAADMAALFDDQHPLAQLSGHAFGDRQTEESGSDNDEVVGGH